MGRGIVSLFGDEAGLMMLKQAWILLILVPVLACSGTEPDTLSPAAPTPVASPANTRFTLGGQVVASRTRAPISEATVSITSGSDAGRTTTTDASGNFSFTDLRQSSVIVEVSATEYFSNRAPLSSQTLTVFLIPLGPAIQLSGRVTDAGTSAPIAAATVYVNGRYRATTDGFGNYSLTGRLDVPGDSNIIWASADEYEAHTRYVLSNSGQSFRLRRIERILAGESWAVTVHPDDSLCFNEYRDPSFAVPGSASLCRTVRLTAQSNGMLKVEAVSTVDGSHPGLIVEVFDATCCGQEMQNPMSVRVAPGVEVLVHVEMPESSATSQSFIVKTSMSP